MFVGRGARIFLLSLEQVTLTLRHCKLNVFVKDIYAMSVEENTFHPHLQQQIMSDKITFKEKSPDLNSKPLSKDRFLCKGDKYKI